MSDEFLMNPEQKKIFKEFCEQEVAVQREHLIKEYGLVDYNPQLFLNFRKNGISNYGGELMGGEPFLTILAKEACPVIGSIDKFQYQEYEFLHHKDGIGNGDANWKQYVAWTIAHELAHSVIEIERFREMVIPFFVEEITKDLRGHGKLWQAVYRNLRVDFCTEEKYIVEHIDFSNYVFATESIKNKVKHILIWKGNSPVDWYIRENGKLYKSTKKWVKKSPSKHQKLPEIVKSHVTY